MADSLHNTDITCHNLPMKKGTLHTSSIQTSVDGDCLTITLPERLESKTINPFWQACMNAQKVTNPKKLTLDASHTQYCDGTGIALLTELKQKQTANNSDCDILNLDTKFQTLLEQIVAKHKTTPKPPANDPFFTTVGKRYTSAMLSFKLNIGFIGEFFYLFCKQICNPRLFRWRTFWEQIETIGPNAFPIAALLGFILGLILAFQALVGLQRYGATIYVINLVTLSLSRELAALMAAIILAGRTASAFAAEIGTMKINQEIDALKSLGIGTVDYLVLPRVVAGILMMPLLTLFLLFFGIIGCYCVMVDQGYSFSIFLHQVVTSFKPFDVWMGLLKALVFGAIIASIGCIHGLKTQNHAVAVGESTTKAVVSSIVMLAIADGILTIIFYQYM